MSVIGWTAICVLAGNAVFLVILLIIFTLEEKKKGSEKHGGKQNHFKR